MRWRGGPGKRHLFVCHVLEAEAGAPEHRGDESGKVSGVAEFGEVVVEERVGGVVVCCAVADRFEGVFAKKSHVVLLV